METIKINDMQTKGVVFIVKYESLHEVLGVLAPFKSGEATLNTTFNKQEIWYLENEVGRGGTVSVEIVNKEKQAGNPAAGFWVNITNVDMTSGVKGKGEILSPTLPAQTNVPQEEQKFRTPAEMTANNLTDIYCRNNLCNEPKFVLDAYNYFLKEL